MSERTGLMITNSNVYDRLKQVAQVVLPALGTLYFALSQIWGLPNGEQVVGTIVALDAFLGVVLSVSTSNYNNSDERFDGTIDVFENDEVERFVLNYDDDPYKIHEKNEILFKVNKVDTEH